MPTSLPPSHVEDALKLNADGLVTLFEISALSGGTVYVKSDNDVTWQGQLYTGLPIEISGLEHDLDKMPEPRLDIGQDNVDLLPFKGIISDGYLEGGVVLMRTLLLEDLLADRNICRRQYFRMKRVVEYRRSKISIALASYSSATRQTVPFRQYLPPAFPWVEL